MTPKLNVIMLAVEDLDRSVAFYEALGFQKEQGGGSMAVFGQGETRLALLTRDVLASLTGEAPASPAASPPALLGHMARSQDEVNAALTEAEGAGGRIVRAAGSNDWGGYSGAFADPDGHVWNVGFNLLFYRA